jgi:hypothetical protein
MLQKYLKSFDQTTCPELWKRFYEDLDEDALDEALLILIIVIVVVWKELPLRNWVGQVGEISVVPFTSEQHTVAVFNFHGGHFKRQCQLIWLLVRLYRVALLIFQVAEHVSCSLGLAMDMENMTFVRMCSLDACAKLGLLEEKVRLQDKILRLNAAQETLRKISTEVRRPKDGQAAKRTQRAKTLAESRQRSVAS